MASQAGGLLLVLLVLFQCLADAFDVNDIAFEVKEAQTYDTVPKMKIFGKGFSGMSAEIDLLELELRPTLPKTHFKASVKDDNTIVLELAPSKRWPCSGDVLSPTLLELKSASFKDTPLPGTPLPIAKVLPTPVVYPSTNIAYLTATPYLLVNGSNFNPKLTELYFTPPLGVGDDITVQVRNTELIDIVLVRKYDDSHRWAEEPGPLKISAISTGGGVKKLRPDLGGITICELQADLEHHGVSVESQALNMYQSSKMITIAGKGFNPEGTKFRFANGIKENTDYTADVEETSAVLTLVEGRKWISNGAALPSELKLLAVDAGDSWVPVGANSAKAGRRVAKIFEDPSVKEGSVEIMRTLSHELIIEGTGFNNIFPPIFVFEPAIDKDDYVVSVCNRTHVKLSLAGAGAGWIAEGTTGNLSVNMVNTGAGMFQLDQPVIVAMVVADADKHESGIDVHVNYNAVLYQSSEKPLVVEGEGFPEGGDLDLEFGGTNVPDREAVKWERVSDKRLKLSLAEGHTWTSEPGPLFLSRLKFGETKVVFQSPGVKIATILEDPIVEASQLHVYATRTKQINIKGRGFFSVYDPQFSPKVVLSPTLTEHFEVISTRNMNSILTLGLKYTASGPEMMTQGMWAKVQDKDEIVDLKVVSIDTGAGPVPMPGGGIVVAAVRMDDDTFYCEDSCVYANDGACDEDQGNPLLSGESMPPSDAAFTSSFSNLSSRKSSGAGDASTALQSGDDMFLDRPRCELGTDCTDCGFSMVEEGSCWNTCAFADDGVCDDPRGYGVCAPGTDCKDCGAWGTDFTTLSTMGEIPPGASDDDVGFLVNDPRDAIFEGQPNNGRGRYHRVFIQHPVTRQESEEGGVLLKDFLWGAITLVGVTVTGVMGVLLIRFLRGEKVDLPIPTNPDVESRR